MFSSFLNFPPPAFAPFASAVLPLAADAPASAPADGSSTILMVVSMFLILYFLFIRPSSKARKEQAALLSSVKIGDKVVMNSGLHGLVSNVKEATVIVKVADNVKLEFDKAAIGTVVKPSADA